MKKALLGIAVFVSGTSGAWAACFGAGFTCGVATRYDVSVQQVALCSDAGCSTSYVVGSGARTFDIASATVGSAIGSYAKVDAVPVGVYSHIRVVVGRTFTISGGAVGLCGAQNAASLSIPNDGSADAALNGAGIFWNDAGKTQIRMTQALPTPIAISKAGNRPSVLIKFNTQQGLMCLDAGPMPLPAPPDVTLTIS